MKRPVTTASVLVLALALSACGGGGGGGGGGVVSTPSPSPTPTPTPSPTPTASNVNLLGPLVTETFANDATIGTATFSATASTSGATTAGPVTIKYDATNQSYALTSATGSITFLPSDLDNSQSSAAALVYVKQNGTTTDTLTLTRPGTSGPVTYTYVGSAFWQRTVENSSSNASGAMNAIAYGVQTPDANVPRTGTASYAVDLIGARTDDAAVYAMTGTGTTIVDFTSGMVLTSGKLTAGIVGTDPFSSVAMLSSTSNAFSGDFQFSDFGEFTGTLNGSLYGPNAEEIGAAWQASSGNYIAVGTLMGRKGSGALTNDRFNDQQSIGDPPLTNSQLFSTSEVTLRTTLAGASGSNNSGEQFSGGTSTSEPLAILYDANSKSYALVAGDRASTLFANTPNYTATGEEKLGPGTQTESHIPGPSVTLNYVRAGTWQSQTSSGGSTAYRISNFVYGMPTAAADVPRTGLGSYRIITSGTVADGDYSNLMTFVGDGVMEADFATGDIRGLGVVDYGEDYFLSGRQRATPSGNFNFSAAITSNANAFTGTMNMTGLGNYTGALNGQFFGPGAKEVGATFTLADGQGGFGTGAFVGASDPTATFPGNVVPLSTLTAPTDLTGDFIYAQDLNQYSSGNITVRYDPATGTYVIDPQGSPMTLSPANRDAAASSASQDTYDVVIDGYPSTYSVVKPGVELTYATFAQAYSRQYANNFEKRYLTFGNVTPSAAVPRTGSASYVGSLLGYGTVNFRNAANTVSTFDQYDVTGTSTLVANFGLGSFDLSLTAQGRSVDNAAIVYDFGTITGTGMIQGNRLSGMLSGYFYGPAANEFAGTFNYNDTSMAPNGDYTNIIINGVAGGRKQ